MLIAALLMFQTTILTSCGSNQEGDQMQTRVDRALNDLDRDRNAVRAELLELRKDIDTHILRLEEDLQGNELGPEVHRDKEHSLKELLDNRARVQQALAELEQADNVSWNEIRARSKKLTRSVDNWFERQAEKEDLRG